MSEEEIQYKTSIFTQLDMEDILSADLKEARDEEFVLKQLDSNTNATTSNEMPIDLQYENDKLQTQLLIAN